MEDRVSQVDELWCLSGVEIRFYDERVDASRGQGVGGDGACGVEMDEELKDVHKKLGANGRT